MFQTDGAAGLYFLPMRLKLLITVYSKAASPHTKTIKMMKHVCFPGKPHHFEIYGF
jgi:hypothetical protein